MPGFTQYDDYDGLGLAELVREGHVSPGELLEEAIARTEKVNGELNAVVHRFYELARTSIERGLPQGTFAGVPFLLKDLHLYMTGTERSNGSAAWAGDSGKHDSTLVQRYKQAGLVIFGRTNSPELGLNPVTEPSSFGPSRNPWDTDRTPGGSSGGAGAAVAAGIVPMAHASDGGGSIRIPASCCGLVGLKPSRGRIPFGPDRAEGWSGQSTSHIVSRSVRDTAAMLDATGGSETGEAYTAPHFDGSFLAQVGQSPGRLNIAVNWSKLGPGEFSAEAVEGLRNTVKLLEDLGHNVEEARPDIDGEAAASALYTIICVDVAAGLTERAAQLGCAVEDLPIEDGTRSTLALGMQTSGMEHLHAIRTNHRLGRMLGHFHERYDLTLAPTMSSVPVPVGHISQAPREEYGERLFNYMGDTGLYNQTGQPSISLPLHWTENTLPIGMMFSAAYGQGRTVVAPGVATGRGGALGISQTATARERLTCTGRMRDLVYTSLTYEPLKRLPQIQAVVLRE